MVREEVWGETEDGRWCDKALAEVPTVVLAWITVKRLNLISNTAETAPDLSTVVSRVGLSLPRPQNNSSHICSPGESTAGISRRAERFVHQGPKRLLLKMMGKLLCKGGPGGGREY